MELWQSLLKSIDNDLPLKKNLEHLAEKIHYLLGVRACNIFLKETETLYTLTASSLTPLLAGQVHINVHDDAVGLAVRREEMVIIDDIYNYSLPTTLNAFSRTRLHRLLCVPVMHQRKAVGIIAVQVTNKERFSENLQTTLVTLALNLGDMLDDFIEKGTISASITQAPPEDRTVTLSGRAVTGGAALGQVVVKYNLLDTADIPDKPTQQDDEAEQFRDAVNRVKASLNHMRSHVHHEMSAHEAALFNAYLQIIDSSSYYNAILDLIREGVWVQTAIRRVTDNHIKAFRNMEDTYLQERANDIRDISLRILQHLQENTPVKQNYPLHTILMAREVTPSMVAEVPKGRLKAIVSERGTESSHATILARALGIPFIINVKSLPESYVDGKEVIVDAYLGKLYISPNKGLRDSYRRLLQNEAAKESRLQEVAHLPAETTDHQIVTLNANVGFIADLDAASAKGASGIGLYRTEIPFMIRDKFPSEEEQRVIYSQFLKAFPDDSVTMRILDVGSDKALPYFTEQEDNPALGWRGIRMLLDHTNVFMIQIRAMLRASAGLNNLKILLPMITDISEIKESVALITRARRELMEEGYQVRQPEVGIMLEVPALLFKLGEVLKHVHFVSIGTNDLAQYLLAIDRNNQKVAHLYSQFHPAMLEVLHHIARTAAAWNKEAAVCGEIAGNPLAVPLLVGMGYRELSMNPINLLKAKWIIRNLGSDKCSNALAHAHTLSSSTAIETYMTNFLIENGLSGMIRAGD